MISFVLCGTGCKGDCIISACSVENLLRQAFRYDAADHAKVLPLADEWPAFRDPPRPQQFFLVSDVPRFDHDPKALRHFVGFAPGIAGQPLDEGAEHTGERSFDAFLVQAIRYGWRQQRTHVA